MKTIKYNGEKLSILSSMTIAAKENQRPDKDVSSLISIVDNTFNKRQQYLDQGFNVAATYRNNKAQRIHYHSHSGKFFKPHFFPVKKCDRPIALEHADTYQTQQINRIKTASSKSSAKKIIKHQLKNITQALKIACIMDEFTYLSFSPEAELLALSPEFWLSEIAMFQPDMLFVESAWQGKNELWKTKISGFADELKQLLAYCQQAGIRSIFWNKEDPIHFGTFLEVAKHVNIVFTTDIDSIAKYKSVLGHDDVYLLPFAAQPKIHNPLERYKRQDRFNFAGSFYLKYPERQRDFMTLANIAHNSKGLDIYDRNFHKPHPHYSFPDYFKSFILGSLAANELELAYKSYFYGINLNTIKQSQSMFARRVFELLASNTVVMSNYSRGLRNFFGDLVLCSDHADELKHQLASVTSSTDNLNKFRLAGVRKVLSEHTYARRLAYIASKLKLNRPTKQQNIAVIAIVNSLAEQKQIISYFTAQRYQHKFLFILNTSERSLAVLAKNIFVKNHTNDIISAVKKNNITHLAFFTLNNYYGHNYLLDMSLSYQYSQYLGLDVITKATYYKVAENGDVYQVNPGKSYSIVSSFELSRSMVQLNDASETAAKYIALFMKKQDAIYISTALSIDEFNYLQDYSNNLMVDEKYLTDSSYAQDYGVNLNNNLLIPAERIPAEHLADKTINVLASLKQVKSNHQLLKCQLQDNQFKINSVLAAHTQHNISLLTHNNILGYNGLEIDTLSRSVGEIALLIDFYHIDGQLLLSKNLKLQNNLKIIIPQYSHYFKITLRIKGTASLVMKKFQFSLHQQQKLADSVSSSNSKKISFSAQKIADYLIKPLSSAITIKEQNKQLNISSTLAQSKTIYCYLKPIFSREELNLIRYSEFKLNARYKGNFSIVFEYLDEAKQKIACAILPIVDKGALAIPPQCHFIKIGLKISGSGTIDINRLELGRIDEPLHCFIAKSDTLVLAKQYPSYDELYNYGFLHSRLKAYKEQGYLVDMFRVTTKEEEFEFSEFEGIDVLSNNHQLLDSILATGQYKRILIHILDQNMWQIVSKYQDKLDIYIWIHGAEAQLWPRRAYDFIRFDDAEIQQQKKLSNARKQFWQQLINSKHPRVKLIFVSDYAKTIFEQDMAVSLAQHDIAIIHNYIDSDLFTYQEKPLELRQKILSIRPYASLTYANDLMVKTILELAKDAIFKTLEFMIIGDGELFAKTLEPIKHFDNVTIQQGFLNHQQIATLHQEYGIFLVPTRMDTQGVSRGEAMSSGLVPITNKVAAIPQFVDMNSGIVVEAEDYKGLAQAILVLNNNPALFAKLSQGAARRVREQTDFTKTILKEINLLFESKRSLYE